MQTCTKCQSNCSSCLNETYCTKCKSGLVLTSFGECLDRCPQGFYSIDGICTPCSADCIDC